MEIKKIKVEEGREWLVMVHGFGGTGAMWRTQIQALGEEYNLALVELHKNEKTYGVKSRQKQKQKTFKEIGEELKRELNQQGIEKAWFLGMSMGCMVIAGLREKHPGMVSGVVYSGMVRLGGEGTRKKCIKFLVDKLNHIIPYEVMVNMGCRLVIPSGYPQGRRLYKRSCKRLGKEGFTWWCRVLMGDIDRCGEDKGEYLVVMGENDIWFRREVERSLGEGQELEVIRDAGHLCNMDAPEEFNEIVKGYLRKRRERRGKD